MFSMAVWSCMACAAFAADVKGNASDPAFAPAVTGDSTLVLGVNFTRELSFKIAENVLGQMLKMPGADKQLIDGIQRKIEVLKRDPWADAPQEAREFLKENNLLDVYPRWGVLSVEGPLRLGDTPDLGQMALAIAIDVDLAKLISAVCKAMKENDDDNISFQEISVEGEKAWQIPNDGDLSNELKAMNANPCLTSLDGKLLLVAMSRPVLEKQIRLYRKGTGKGDALCGFSAADGELLHVNVSGIGDVIHGATPPDALRGTNQGVMAEIAPIIEEIIFGLKSLSTDIKVSKEGAVGLTMRLKAGSEDDAELIRTLTGAVLVIAKTFASRSPDVPKEVAGALKSFHIGGLENTIELRCDNVLSILAGSMIPAIASAQLSANMSAKAMTGRNIFVSITQANTEREAAGLASVWPRTHAPASDDRDDIAGMTYKKSTDYFRDLCDKPNYGTDKWSPYVSGCDLNAFGKDLDLWHVAANVTDEMPDCIPVLISANFDPALLPSKWDGSSDDLKRLPIGPAHGEWGDKAIVVIRKGGAAQVIKQENLTYETLYCGQSFDLTGAEPPVVYLTPKGIAAPAAR